MTNKPETTPIAYARNTRVGRHRRAPGSSRAIVALSCASIFLGVTATLGLLHAFWTWVLETFGDVLGIAWRPGYVALPRPYGVCVIDAIAVSGCSVLCATTAYVLLYLYARRRGCAYVGFWPSMVSLLTWSALVGVTCLWPLRLFRGYVLISCSRTTRNILQVVDADRFTHYGHPAYVPLATGTTETAVGILCAVMTWGLILLVSMVHRRRHGLQRLCRLR